MDKSFSWQNFDRMAKLLESVGYVVAVFGPLVGVAMLIFGDNILRITGAAVLVASALVAAYHISFSLLMNAVQDIMRHLEMKKEELPVK